MSPGVTYTRVKYLRVWDITVTVEVDSTEKNRWVTIIVLAWSACIITNVSFERRWARLKPYHVLYSHKRTTIKYK